MQMPQHAAKFVVMAALIAAKASFVNAKGAT
jgi:hypothetical protein